MRFEMGLLQPLLATRQLGNSHFPCPNGNSTRIGDIQKFDVFCGKDNGGVEIDRMQLDSLNTCVNIWFVSFLHPVRMALPSIAC
jgi:hypothetical protein